MTRAGTSAILITLLAGELLHAQNDDLMRKGAEQLQAGKFGEAEETYRTVWAAEPSQTRGMEGVVTVYLRQNKQEEALRLVQTESAKNPARMDFHLVLGNTAVRIGKYDLAIAEFQTVAGNIGKDPKAVADIFLRIGETYRRMGKPDAAIEALEEARLAAPDSSIILSTLALTFDMAGRTKEAIRAYEDCLKLDPANGVALNNLAYLLLEAGGDLNRALTYAMRAKELLPEMLEVDDTIAMIYLRLGRKEEAIKILRDLMEKAPNREDFRTHLGVAQAQTNPPAAAKQ